MGKTDPQTDHETVEQTDQDAADEDVADLDSLEGLLNPAGDGDDDDDDAADGDGDGDGDDAGGEDEGEGTDDGEGSEAADGDEDAGEGDGKGTAAAPQDPAPRPNKAAAQPSAADKAAEAYQQRLQKFNADFTKLKATIAAPDYRPDPYSDEQKEFTRLQLEQMELQTMRLDLIEEQNRQANLPNEYEAMWRTFAKKPENKNVPVKKARDAWEEEFEKAAAKYEDEKVVQAVAFEAWQHRLRLLRGHAKKTGGAAAAAAPNTAAGKARTQPTQRPAPRTGQRRATVGGRITPIGSPANRPPASKEPEDELAAELSGDDVRSLLG